MTASVQPNFTDMDDDDEMPLRFKRGNMASKSNVSNSEPNTSLSQKHDGQVGRQISNTNSLNGQNSTVQKDNKTVPSSKASPVKSPLVSPRLSPPTSKTSPANTVVKNSKPLASPANRSTNLNQCRSNTVVMEEKPSVSDPNGESDSEDDKPLSNRVGLPKSSSNHCNKVPGASTSCPKVVYPKDEDSDDEMPLSTRIKMKSNPGASTMKSSDTNKDNKPVLPKCEQNGSAPSTVPSKRSPVEIKSAGQSSVKKPRLSDTSVSAKSKQPSVKEEKNEDDDEDNIPISQRIKKSSTPVNKSKSTKKATAVVSSSHKIIKKKFKKVKKNSKYSQPSKVPPSSGEAQKWTTLVHNGVIFPPPYKPHGVKMLYKGQPVDLTPEQEEVATMYAVMLDTEYMSKPKFKENFMNDWKKLLGRNHVIQSLEHCDFSPIYDWHQKEKEKKKQMSSEEKKALKEEKLKQEEKYMWAILDGVKEKVGNFRVEPPGLFRGRGEHPKMGKLKKRIRPSDITINIGKDAPIPECPIPGESWKEIKHDNTVTWLAFWNDPINPKEFKYVFLAASSTLKGQSDKEKYEKARLLKEHIDRIRAAYTKDFNNKDPVKRQVAVATYLIDKLALRAGNEKDDDEAETVGCCTLKVENVEPVPPDTLKFDFLGKDSIRYQNDVRVLEPVFKAIQHFRKGKKDGDDLFDMLDTSKLNAHLKELMPGLTAKVFRTFNASITLQLELARLTKGGDVAEKHAVYQVANKQVAVICNHQRSVSKTHALQISRLNEKIEEAKSVLEELKIDLARAKKGKPPLKSADGKTKRNLAPESLQKKIDEANKKIKKMEKEIQTKEDLKNIALGTSKINYLDPRISVAWCKRNEVPIERIFNKSLMAKFAWAMDVDPDFSF
ncbi:PREDICTED: DNA topoisomerase 1 beta-like [Ipomoea nil]|uniref:DNA topoisomerase 1 beta-like n=1 Tax=Ipomoea nil TaxID=35883 RepID=UPI000901A896|nr:PREDICTED: DNA topoisomerase 1 beta-like [Ipomoea nil]